MEEQVFTMCHLGDIMGEHSLDGLVDVGEALDQHRSPSLSECLLLKREVIVSLEDVYIHDAEGTPL